MVFKQQRWQNANKRRVIIVQWANNLSSSLVKEDKMFFFYTLCHSSTTNSISKTRNRIGGAIVFYTEALRWDTAGNA